MCHQTVGLVARQIEATGIPTLSLTSARDITAAANPPRAAFLDFPLGHTAGRPGDPEGNREILRRALAVFATAQPPSTIVDLPFEWSHDHTWKDTVMRARPTADGREQMIDERLPRHPTPRYQSPADEQAAARSHEGLDCVVCPGIDY